MPFVRWNCEPSQVEEGCRFRARVDAGLVTILAERRPSASIALTMTASQALVLSDLLRRASRASRDELQQEVNRGTPHRNADRRS